MVVCPRQERNPPRINKHNLLNVTLLYTAGQQTVSVKVNPRRLARYAHG